MNDSDAPLLVSRPGHPSALCWVRIGTREVLCWRQAVVEIQGSPFCEWHGAVVLAGGIEEALERT